MSTPNPQPHVHRPTRRSPSARKPPPEHPAPSPAAASDGLSAPTAESAPADIGRAPEFFPRPALEIPDETLSARLRSIRARYYYGLLDAVYTAPARADQPAEAFLRDVLKRRAANFERVGSLARYLSAHAPGSMTRFQGRLQRTAELPLRAPVVRPLGYGTRSTCVLLDGSPARVLKFLRSSLGHDIQAVTRMSRLERDFYETLRRWYGDIPGILPHTVHLVMRAPLRGVPAAAQIQDLIVGQFKDLLQDHTDRMLIELLERHDPLRDHYRRFVAASRRAWDHERLSLDLVGLNNVLLLDGVAGPELRIADFGIWHLEEQSRRRPRIYARGARALERLERIAELIAR